MYNWMKWLRLLGGWHFIAATAIKPSKAACQFAADDILLYEFYYYNPMDLLHHLEKGKEELSPLQYHIKSLHIISRHYKKSLLRSQIYHGYEELSMETNYSIWRRQERRSKYVVQLASWQLRSNSPKTSVRSDFRAFAGEGMEGMAWNFACWYILTTFRRSQIYHGYEELSMDTNYRIWRRQGRRSKYAVQLASWQLRSNSPKTSVRPKPETPCFHLYIGPLVHPTNRDRFTPCLSVRPSGEISGYLQEKAWREWPKILHADISWLPSELIR